MNIAEYEVLKKRFLHFVIFNLKQFRHKTNMLYFKSEILKKKRK